MSSVDASSYTKASPPSHPGIVRVALRRSALSFDQLYSYFDPYDAQVGQRVRIPFGRGNRAEEALVVEREEAPFLPESLVPRSKWVKDDGKERKLKSLAEIMDPEPWLSCDQIVLAAQMRLRYNCTWSQALGTMLPPLDLSTSTREQYYYLKDPEGAHEALLAEEHTTVEQLSIVEVLLDYEGAIPRTELLSAAGVSDSPLRTLKKKGLVDSATREKLPEPYRAIVLEERSLLPDDAEIPAIYREPKALNAEQQAALDALLERPGEYLLQGITGSGKTEVYLAYAETIIKEGGGLIILVPEIALTTQMIQRFSAHFGRRIALWHSRLSPRERQEEWRKIAHGDCDIVLGARSAVFMPLPNLRAIIIDEAHEPAFASEHQPRYHASTIARLRVKAMDGTLILGSATPSAEDYARTLDGRSRRLLLTKRAGPAYEPKIQTVDLKRYVPGIYQSLLSPPLIEALRGCFARGEQAMLFLNRRGYASSYLCEACGEQINCPRCSVKLHYHRKEDRLLCHYCGLVLNLPEFCPHCGEDRLRQIGFGTEQLMERCRELFPEQRIQRMDQDTTRHRKAYEDILGDFRDGKIQLLVGTQMIAKGHDFPKLTVVGILGIEEMLNLGSFRAEERAYQLIVQAAGRAGRKGRPGEVYLQTYDPKHPVIRAVLQGGFEAFMREELKFRQNLGYPPYGAIAQILISGLDESRVALEADRLFRRLQDIDLPADLAEQRPEILAPIPAPIARLRYHYRYLLTLKSPNEFLLSRYLRLALLWQEDQDLRISVSLDPA